MLRRLLATGLLLAAMAAVRAAEPKFLTDDPLTREPETADASGVQAWDIDLLYDLGYNLVVTPRRQPANLHAQNVNTIDEVPDSSWFTNRIGTRPISEEELTRGAIVGPAPDPSKWTITREKNTGDAPGFTARDAGGGTWFVSFDSPRNPDGASGALAVANRLFWALGYNQVEYFVTQFHPDRVTIEDTAVKPRPNGRRTTYTRDDLNEVLERAHRRPDGSFRAAAGRLLPGKVVGGFKYDGTRPDDPNDIVPHQHRRELRALRVFGAWTNLTDMKAGNTIDTVVTEGGRGVVRHYLQDVGSTFGVGANGPHEWREGWEHVFDRGASLRRFLSFGFAFSPWQTAHYEEYDAVGRFEADAFEPTTWKPRVPTAAYLEMQPDDAFWAARRVMAFSDAMIRAVVKTAQFADPKAEQHLADVLIARRDKVGRAYLTAINPIVDPRLDASGTLTFGNAAVDHRLADAPASYAAHWAVFDNATGTATPLGETTAAGASMAAPAGLPTAAGAYVQVDLTAAHAAFASWARPVRAWFKREGAGWILVGLERQP